MPFLRLTRDRRGYENTFLLHADRVGERPRVLYWYRTAPDVLIGRSALDEDAIRTLEEQHPHIEFDWPAILALKEVLPSEQEPGRQVDRHDRQERRGGRSPRGRGNDRPRDMPPRPSATASPAAPDPLESEPDVEVEHGDVLDHATEVDAESEVLDVEPEAIATRPSFLDERPATTHGLLEGLVGREIATRLRARHSEILTRIREQAFDDSARDRWIARADAIDPDTWLTPDAILSGVRNADQLFDALRNELLG